MKVLLAVTGMALLAGPVAAEDYWFALDPGTYPVPEDLTHYASADEACKKAYADEEPQFEGKDWEHILPYESPELRETNPFFYNCNVSYTYNLFGNWTTVAIPHLIAMAGDSCPDGLMLDVYAGQCESPEDFNRRRQMGDPNNSPNNDPNDCQGNPINAAIGNKFELETDFVDDDGELAFRRYYNGLGRQWRHSYSASLLVAGNTVSITFDDGRISLFTVSGTTATGEPSERGLLTQSRGTWTYSGPDNQTLTFNSLGQLTSVRSPMGLTSRVAQGYDSDFNTQVTVTDSRGHVLKWTEDTSGKLAKMTAGALVVTYVYSDAGLLTSASRQVAGKTTSRTYVYDDPNDSALLTGLVDERGIRFATWSYDDQGRAVSSEHAGGTDKVTITYVDDATTKVTNALGHTVTYTYTVAAGTRRMSHVQGEPVPGCPISNSSFTYDARGQIATKTDALGHVTAFVYDAQGRETSRTEAQGTPEERVTTTTWDGTSFRPKTVTTPDRVTTYTYDTKGRLTSTSVGARVQ